jgi:hypothetical protein
MGGYLVTASVYRNVTKKRLLSSRLFRFHLVTILYATKRKQTPLLLVRERTIPTERPPLVEKI